MLRGKSLTPPAQTIAHGVPFPHIRLSESGKWLLPLRTRRQNVYTIATILFARNQEDHVAEIFVVDWRDAFGNGLRQNFPAVIDVEGICKLQARAWGNDTVQVNHPCALLPHERVEKVVAIRGPANNLASFIDSSATAARLAIQRPQVENLTVFPSNRIMDTFRRQVGRAGNYSRVVNPNSLRATPAQRTQVFH